MCGGPRTAHAGRHPHAKWSNLGTGGISFRAIVWYYRYGNEGVALDPGATTMTLFKGCADCEALWSEYVTATDQYLRIKAATLRPEASPEVLTSGEASGRSVA